MSSKPKAPKAPKVTKAEIKANAEQVVETAKQKVEEVRLQSEKDRQDEQRRRRGAGIQSFMGPGVAGGASALSTMLGV